ncbi:hypothetical protein SAMN02745135_02043 [Caloranaerobacter azorensis DSM 13643]|uniref:Uncharacterized protein n=1 Tax=Caloranaerobacter azorensis DSM 13643 TaxID=1121264 RepID=A0A1M5VP25_9FIRM|nr:hypothetical protein [Caloranaerobacter azorensis]SHH76985.1 hypothetical protein SAMN02745135_02043 [Caloranaerobacter azorensis DSM 13643]
MLDNSLKKEIHLLIVNTIKELVVSFNKSLKDAENIVKKTKMEEYILKHPITLRDSAYDWAVKLLTEIGDIETLEKYLK